MLDIRIEGVSVDRKPGMVLTLEQFSPLFDFSTVQGSRIYDFQLPSTPTNRRVLGHLHNPQVESSKRRWYCEKYHHSTIVEQGYVKIRETTPDYSLYFTQNLGDIFGDYQLIPLSQLTELGSEPVPASPVASVDPLVDRYCFPTLHNPAFYGNQAVGGFTGKVNEQEAGLYKPTARVPMLFVHQILKRYGELTGWRFEGAFMDDPAMQRLVFYNLYALDEQTTLTYSNHLPEITLGGLLIELRKLFNLWLDFNVRRKICTMDFVDDVLAQPTLTNWSYKTGTAHLRIPDQHGRLELSYEIDGNDATMKPIPALMDKYQTPENEENAGGVLLPVKSRFSTLLTDPVLGLATTSQTGFSVLNKDSKPVLSNRLLFWNGLVAGVPTATNAHAGQTLLWSGAGNLVDTHWRRFERFKGRTFPIRRNLYLSAADLARFTLRQKVHIQGVDYLISSLKTALGDDPILICEAELWRV
ncbi:hypothetical protein ACS5NO_20895 [Larkinella sp. GY13]|uniref:hypothetical protein n=1 Tax=Larkinella sp. GY13 TaxID=3453720 RepID=UPI003EEE22F1